MDADCPLWLSRNLDLQQDQANLILIRDAKHRNMKHIDIGDPCIHFTGIFSALEFWYHLYRIKEQIHKCTESSQVNYFALLLSNLLDNPPWNPQRHSWMNKIKYYRSLLIPHVDRPWVKGGEKLEGKNIFSFNYVEKNVVPLEGPRQTTDVLWSLCKLQPSCCCLEIVRGC